MCRGKEESRRNIRKKSSTGSLIGEMLRCQQKWTTVNHVVKQIKCKLRTAEEGSGFESNLGTMVEPCPHRGVIFRSGFAGNMTEVKGWF